MGFSELEIKTSALRYEAVKTLRDYNAKLNLASIR